MWAEQTAESSGYLDENSDLQRTIVEPTNGNTIVSTLDINIQQVVGKSTSLNLMRNYGKDAEDGKGAKNIQCHRRKSAERRDLRWRAATDLTSRIRTI